MIFCNECGATVEDGMRFCAECGAAMVSAAFERPAAPPPPQPPPVTRSGPFGAAPATVPLPTYQPEPAAPSHLEQPSSGGLTTAPLASGSKPLAGILGGVAVVAIAVAAYFGFSDTQASRLAGSLKSAVNSGRLVTLSNDDAYSFYFQLRGLDPTNKALKEAGMKTLPQLRQMGDEVFRKKVSVQSEKLLEQDWSKALRVYELAHAIEPSDKTLEARWKFSEGEVFKSQGKKDDAERSFSTASQLQPSWALPVNSIGLLRTESKRWNDSIPYYQRAMGLEPNWEIPYNNMGSAYLGLKDYTTAESWYRRALGMNPNWARPHWHIGSVYEAANRLPEALNEYQTALNLDPNGYSIEISSAQKKIDWLQRKLQR